MVIPFNGYPVFSLQNKPHLAQPINKNRANKAGYYVRLYYLKINLEMSMTSCYLYVMIGRYLKKTYTYATRPLTKHKAKLKAQSEGMTLSAKIDQLLSDYIKPKESNKKNK